MSNKLKLIDGSIAGQLTVIELQYIHYRLQICGYVSGVQESGDQYGRVYFNPAYGLMKRRVAHLENKIGTAWIEEVERKKEWELVKGGSVNYTACYDDLDGVAQMTDDIQMEYSVLCLVSP